MNHPNKTRKIAYIDKETRPQNVVKETLLTICIIYHISFLFFAFLHNIVKKYNII